MPPHDMECTLFPDLWFNVCCVMHDLTDNDLGLLFCMVGSSVFVITGVWAFYMFVGRPIRRWLYSKGILKDE